MSSATDLLYAGQGYANMADNSAKDNDRVTNNMFVLCFTQLSTLFQSYHMAMCVSDVIYPLRISLYVTRVIEHDRITVCVFIRECLQNA